MHDEKKTDIASLGISSPARTGLGVLANDIDSVDGLDILDLATDEHPAHPRHWSLLKRWTVLAVLCSFQSFVYLFDSTIHLT